MRHKSGISPVHNCHGVQTCSSVYTLVQQSTQELRLTLNSWIVPESLMSSLNWLHLGTYLIWNIHFNSTINPFYSFSCNSHPKCRTPLCSTLLWKQFYQETNAHVLHNEKNLRKILKHRKISKILPFITDYAESESKSRLIITYCCR